MTLIRTYRTLVTRLGLVFIAMFIALLGVWKFYELKSHRKAVQQQILEGIPDSKLTVFEFDANELASLNWEHSKEFNYQSEKFDLVRAQYNNGVFKLWCWRDVKESLMDKNLKSLVYRFLGSDPSENKDKTALSLLYKSIFFNGLTEYNLARISDLNLMGFNYNNSFNSVSLDVPHSPPQV